MSEESQFTKPQSGRRLRSEESSLIKFLLQGLYSAMALNDSLEQAYVIDMQDGGMGSIRFLSPSLRSFGETLVEAQYCDSDGVTVSITLSADKKGDLLEMDFWKVNFSRLERYPHPADVQISKKCRGR